MDYHLFPSYLPNHSVVAAVASKVVQEWIRPFKANKRTLMDFRTVDAMSQPVTHVLTVPAQYALPIRQLVYRRFALAIMLHNTRRLRIRPRRFWTTLAQNLLYVDDIWKRCLAKSDQSSHEIGKQALSDILDAYIITEAVVGRHEPVYVSAYRMKRRPEDPNISQTPFEDFDLSDYRETLACHPELSGRTYGSLIPCVPVGLSIVKKMLAEASEWYDDKERRVIWDPYTETWCEMGLEPRDPFDPRIEETEEEEGEIPNIRKYRHRIATFAFANEHKPQHRRLLLQGHSRNHPPHRPQTSQRRMMPPSQAPQTQTHPQWRRVARRSVSDLVTTHR
ncbi:hypothetical protein J3R83DRAFT_4391 [Lanmaoa asiatica]|nr:hypothetical protein J3R83DRAFT_4391 [Lanmaoa asiatica]